MLILLVISACWMSIIAGEVLKATEMVILFLNWRSEAGLA